MTSEEAVDAFHVNDLLLRNLPHVVEKIFLDYLDPPDFEASLTVCRTWRRILSKQVLESARNRERLEEDRIAHLWHKERPEQKELAIPTTKNADGNIFGFRSDVERFVHVSSFFSFSDRVVVVANCVPAATIVVVLDLQGNVVDGADLESTANVVCAVKNDDVIIVTFPVGFDRGFDRAKCFDFRTLKSQMMKREMDLGALHSAVQPKDFVNGLGKLNDVKSNFFTLLKVDDNSNPEKNVFCLWRLQTDQPGLLEMKSYREFHFQDHRCKRSDLAHAIDEQFVFIGCNHGFIMLYDHLADAILWQRQKHNTVPTKEIQVSVNSFFAITHEVDESVPTDPLTSQKISIYDVKSGEVLKQLEMNSFHHFAPCLATDSFVAALWKKTNEPFRPDLAPEIRPELKFQPFITVLSLKTFKSFDLKFSFSQEVMLFKLFQQRLLFVQIHEQRSRKHKILVFNLDRPSTSPNSIFSTTCKRPFTVIMVWEELSGLALLSRIQNTLNLLSFQKVTDFNLYLEQESEDIDERRVKKLRQV